MKKILLSALLLLVAGVQTAVAQKMIVTLDDDSKVEYNITKVKDVTFVEAEPEEQHEWVDLDLPSGTLWATCNVGANSPEEYGDYFAWGETEPKNEYSWSTYKYCNGSSDTLTKYCYDSSHGINAFADTLIVLLPNDDAATVNWGSGWQMPNLTQIQELCNSSYTTTEWTTQNGVRGRLVRSNSNGNSIFLPTAGYLGGTSLKYLGVNGYYWSRSLSTSYSTNAYYLYFYSGYIGWLDDGRCYGQSVRPVRKQ